MGKKNIIYIANFIKKKNLKKKKKKKKNSACDKTCEIAT
jgi:hypothetical protein